MKLRAKKYAFFLAAVFCIFNSAFSIGVVRAESNDDPFGLQKTAISAGIPGADKSVQVGPATLVGTLIGYVLAFVGVIFFAIMVYAGFLWMTARGAADQVKHAKDMMEQAAIGIVIVFLSYVVTSFVLKTLLSTTGGT